MTRGGEASEYAWLLPLLCDGLVGAIMLGVLLRLGEAHVVQMQYEMVKNKTEMHLSTT